MQKAFKQKAWFEKKTYELLNQTIQETTASAIPSTDLRQELEDINIQETERIEIL